MRDKKETTLSLPPPPIYEAQPPLWLPPTHGTADLGYPGFYPPRPSQDEEKLSASNVKSGFILPQPVSVETFSAQSMINEKLRTTEVLSKLEDMMNDVFTRRAERKSQIPPSTFRMPTRVTLNESKRQAWFADLANPDVPLHKLGKSVPHGAKGHDLLDLLQSHDVEISRALWVLRVFGANETAGLRNKPSYNPTQYSLEWANVVTGYLRKQLYEIALPSAPRPGLNIKQTFKGVLSDLDSRERWINKFAYSLKLLRTFYAEGLVDSKTFSVWLVQQMATCNLAQAGFITRLADEYLESILGMRPLARPFAEACLNKVAEIRSTSAQDILVSTERLLKTLLQRLCLAIPSVFISPRLWATHSTLIEAIMGENMFDLATANHRASKSLQESLTSVTNDIRKRNEALSFLTSPAKVSAKLSAAVTHVKLLNSISRESRLSTIHYFDHDHPKELFAEKLDMLLTWSVTPLQYGDHRPFAAVTIIQQWCTRASQRATRRGCQNPQEFLQDHLFEWLDTSEVAGEKSNIQSVALLYGKLVKAEMFSYPAYIQRLIARGESGLAYSDPTPSRHRIFLSWIPLFNSTPSLILQRKAILYGLRSRTTPEDKIEKDIREEIRHVLPVLFNQTATKEWLSTAELLKDCPSLTKSSRYEQVRTFRQWLLPNFQKAAAVNTDRAAMIDIYNLCVELMDFSKCFSSILEISLGVLTHASDTEYITCVIDTFRRYSTIWTCMEATAKFVQALSDVYHRWRAQGLQSRLLLSVLLEPEHKQYLSEASRAQIIMDMNAFVTALHPVVMHPDYVPAVLPEVGNLALDTNADAPSILANSLWIKYRTSSEWAARVWENTLSSLRNVAAANLPEEESRAIALRYSHFLLKVDQHLSTGLDGYIHQWFVTVGRTDMPLLQSSTWKLLEYTLLFLVIQGSLTTTTVLAELVYPAWQLAASSANDIDPGVLAYLNSARSLFEKLLLQDTGEINSGDLPRDIFDLQRLRTRRRIVYYEPHFSKLVEMVPLLIYIESVDHLPNGLRAELSTLRRRLCQDRRFRQGAYRNLEVIREAFETSPYLMDTSSEGLRRDAVAGLRLILWDSNDDGDIGDWPEVSSLLSPWKLAATTIQMQFQVKQLGRALGQEDTHQFANDNLNKLTLMLFQHTKTAEEAYYVGEMTKGSDFTVAMKFIKAGLNFMKDMLMDPQADKGSDSCPFKRLGELLRILIHVTAPFRNHPGHVLVLDTPLQEEFLRLLCSKLASLETAITAEVQGGQERGQKEDLVLVVRLLQFILNFRETSWTPAMMEVGQSITKSLFHLVMYFGSGYHIDDDVFPILFDTLLFLYDEMAPDPKGASYDPFKYYQSLPASSLPIDIPTDYRHQILTITTQHIRSPTVSDLASASRDARGDIIVAGAVVNRPWEWVENLGDPVDAKPSDDNLDRSWFQQTTAIKNSGSLSLELFGAHATGDKIINNLVDDDSEREMLHTLDDGLSVESVFARDWRETRVPSSMETVAEHLQAMLLSGPRIGTHSYDDSGAGSKTHSRSSPGASSVVSRSSARASTSSKRQSPNQGSKLSVSTHGGDTMEVDAAGPRSRKATSNKRKAESDDEIEIVEGPVPVRIGPKRIRSGNEPAPPVSIGVKGKGTARRR